MAKDTKSAGIGGRPRRKPEVSSLIDRIVDGTARRYCRARDLPSLIALWPHELADSTPEGGLRILAKLRRALRAERRRARAGHWSYELNRHLALLSAYKGEIALLRAEMPLSPRAPAAARPASAAVETQTAAKEGLRSRRQAR